MPIPPTDLPRRADSDRRARRGVWAVVAVVALGAVTFTSAAPALAQVPPVTVPALPVTVPAAAAGIAQAVTPAQNAPEPGGEGSGTATAGTPAGDAQVPSTTVPDAETEASPVEEAADTGIVEALDADELALLARLVPARAAYADALAAHSALQAKIAAAKTDITAKTDDVTSARDDLEAATRRVERAQLRYDTDRGILSDQAVGAFIHFSGGTPASEVLATDTATSRDGAAGALGEAIVHAQADTTHTSQQRLARAERAEDAATTALADAKTALTEARDEHTRLVRDRDGDTGTVAVIARAAADLDAVVAQAQTLARDKAAAAAALEAAGFAAAAAAAQGQAVGSIGETLAQRQSGQEAAVAIPGTLSAPLPAPFHVGSRFNPHRLHPIHKIVRPHNGDDWGAPMGTPIVAAADGVVVGAGSAGGYGLTVVIDHGQALGTLYAHSSKLLVSEGDTVKRGDVIALIGSTGTSTGPHLHFEVRVHGVPVDPQLWM